MNSGIASFRNLFFFLFVFLLASCGSKRSPSKANRQIEEYETKARTYNALSKMQGLSPPYSLSGKKGSNLGLHNELHRMNYLNEARRYERLAEEAKKAASQATESESK